jgi:thiol:disulfide interchange protein
MARLQRILAIPMALTAAACLWLLWRQGGETALWIGLAALLVLAALLFAYGRAQLSGRRLGTAVLASALLGTAAAAYALPIAGSGTRVVAGAEPWSETRVAAARAAGRPVFLYFTADWCLSCKVNEANAIDRAPVRQAFKQARVEVLAGDWTNGDPAITRFLESRGRAGVPLYLWYAPGAAEPEELPQLLTPAMLTERAERLR